MSSPILDAQTFWELLDRRVAATPDRMMLVDEAGRVMTFAGFKDQAERVAAGLLAMGVTQGTPVTWVLPTRIETVLLSFALSRLGAVQNPIIHIYRKREVGFCVRQTGARLIVHPGIWAGCDYGAMVGEVVAGLDHECRVLVGYDTLPEGDPATLGPPPGAGDAGTVRWLYYTSGTTSDPKGVKHTDASLIAGGTGLARALGMSAEDVGS
ncbi:MAG: AMP-binding protein, partial [Acidimicrobiaceae bacterium]|nr:AMP-binding protein [Acidimicrobiaceae bacterium]